MPPHAFVPPVLRQRYGEYTGLPAYVEEAGLWAIELGRLNAIVLTERDDEATLAVSVVIAERDRHRAVFVVVPAFHYWNYGQARGRVDGQCPFGRRLLRQTGCRRDEQNRQTRVCDKSRKSPHYHPLTVQWNRAYSSK